LFWSCLRSNHLRGEPTLAVGFRTPLILSMLSVQLPRV
jgi:hypothetical protein